MESRLVFIPVLALALLGALTKGQLDEFSRAENGKLAQSIGTNVLEFSIVSVTSFEEFSNVSSCHILSRHTMWTNVRCRYRTYAMYVGPRRPLIG